MREPDASTTNGLRIDRGALSIHTLGEEPKDYEYWLTRPPLERLAAVETIRCMHHGEECSSWRVQRVLEIVDLE